MCLHVRTSTHTCARFDLHTGKLLSKHNLVFFFFFLTFLFKRGRIDVSLQSFFVKTYQYFLLFYLFVNISCIEDAMVTKRLKKKKQTKECVHSVK